MKIYVASKFEAKVRVRSVQAQLRLLGHKITFDWTVEDNGDRTGMALLKYQSDCAAKDLQGVRQAELFLILTHPGMQGGFVELGYALAHCPNIIAVGDSTCIFYRLPSVTIVSTDEQAIEMIQKRAESLRKTGSR